MRICGVLAKLWFLNTLPDRKKHVWYLCVNSDLIFSPDVVSLVFPLTRSMWWISIFHCRILLLVTMNWNKGSTQTYGMETSGKPQFNDKDSSETSTIIPGIIALSVECSCMNHPHAHLCHHEYLLHFTVLAGQTNLVVAEQAFGPCLYVIVLIIGKRSVQSTCNCFTLVSPMHTIRTSFNNVIESS